MLITSNYDNMGNAKKTVIHIPKFRLLNICLYSKYSLLFRNVTDLQQILEIKNNFVLKKKVKNFKIKFKKRGGKLKCSIDKRTILLQ